MTRKKTDPTAPNALETFGIGERLLKDAAVRAQQAGLCPHEWAIVSATLTAQMLVSCAPTPAEGAYLLSRTLSGVLASIAHVTGPDVNEHNGEMFENLAETMTHEILCGKPPKKTRGKRR